MQTWPKGVFLAWLLYHKGIWLWGDRGVGLDGIGAVWETGWKPNEWISGISRHTYSICHFCWKMNKYSMWEWMKHLAERFSIGREFAAYVCSEPLGNTGTRNALLGNLLGCFLCTTQVSASSLRIQHKSCFISRILCFLTWQSPLTWF